MSGYFLGVDAGGSRTRAALVSEQGKVVGVGIAGPANFRTGSFAIAAKAVQQAVRQTLGKTRLKGVQAVCIGSAGLEEPGTEAEGRALLGEVVKADAVLLDTDAYIAWAGALKARPGIIVLSGTGSICLGVDENDFRHRVGGWGPYFGDEGSAYAIASEAIREALKVLDGRSRNGDILKAFLLFADLPPTTSRKTAHAVTSWLYNKERSSTLIARFAPTVERLAAENDEISQTILIRAGHDLGALAQDLAKSLALSPVLISFGGSVLQRNSFVRQAFLSTFDNLRHIMLVEPELPPVLGAALTAMRSVECDVSDRVFTELGRYMSTAEKRTW